MFHFVKMVGQNREMVSMRVPAIFSANLLHKRNAGHSEAANRKQAKEASNKKKSQLIQKLRKDIYKEIINSKLTNPETNPRLNAIFNEANKHRIAEEYLTKYIKTLEAFVKNENFESHVFNHSLGIVLVIDINELHKGKSKREVQQLLDKYGFKYIGKGNEIFKLLGIISCTPLESNTKNEDKFLEDAILANCEEVVQKEDGTLEFICGLSALDDCKNALENIGYKINLTEKRYGFPDYIKVNESVLETIDKIQQKFENMTGFLRLSHNIMKD